MLFIRSCSSDEESKVKSTRYAHQNDIRGTLRGAILSCILHAALRCRLSVLMLHRCYYVLMACSTVHLYIADFQQYTAQRPFHDLHTVCKIPRLTLISSSFGDNLVLPGALWWNCGWALRTSLIPQLTLLIKAPILHVPMELNTSTHRQKSLQLAFHRLLDSPTKLLCS